MIWSLDNGTAKTFVDGALVDTRLFSIATVAGEGCIGQNTLAGGLNEYWKGKIDQVRIYNRALSSLEAAQLHQNEAPTPVITTIHYRFC